MLQKVDPRIRYVWALAYALVGIVLTVILAVGAIKKAIPLHWGFLPALLALSLAFGWLMAGRAYQNYGYALLDDGLWIQGGIFWQYSQFVPRARVQHTEVTHGPIDRKMGLAKLVVHTAGIRLQALSIGSLNHDTAHALRDALLKR